MRRLHRSMLAALAGGILLVAPAVAQVPSGSVIDQIHQQNLQELVREQRDAELRARAGSRNVQAERGVGVQGVPTRVSVEALEAVGRRHTRWGGALLATGAMALAGGFAAFLGAEDGQVLTRVQGTAMLAGFGVTVAGWERLDRAADTRWRLARARAEHLARHDGAAR